MLSGAVDESYKLQEACERGEMRKRLLIIIAGCFYYSGLVALVRWWTRRSGRHVVILNYHTASGGQFLRHVLYLRRHYRILHIDVALEELFTSASSADAHTKTDRRTPLVMTFDDGYVDNFTYATEIARNYYVPLSIYLIPDYITTGKRFWWFEGQSMARRARATEVVLGQQVFRLQDDHARGALAQYIDDRARYATSVAEREMFLDAAREKLELSPQPDERDRDWERLPVNWDQVIEMDKSAWISFGAHTMHHPILAYLIDPAEIQREVTECRQVLEHKLGHPVRTFAYPVGQVQHIDAGVVQAVKDAGYDWAVTTTYGLNTSASDPYRLKRIEADVTQHWLVVASEAAGLWGFFSRLRWLPFIRKNFTNAARKKGI